MSYTSTDTTSSAPAVTSCGEIRMRNIYLLSVWSLLFSLLTWMTPSALAEPTGNIKAGDSLYVEVYRVPELTGSLQVDSKGFIRMSYAGSIKVMGIAESEAAARIAKALTTYVRNPRVTVNRTEGFNQILTLSTGRTEEMVIEVVQLKNARAEDMHTTIEGMGSAGGTVSFNSNSNSLVISDTPKTLTNMKMVIQQLDGMQSQLTQVSIETKIAEVKAGALKELGIKWFAQGDHGSAGFTPSTNVNNLTNPFIPGTDGSQDPIGLPIPGQAFFGYNNIGIDFRSLLDMLVTEEDAEVLANPTTMTVNHQESQIEMIDRIPYTEFGTYITGETSFSTKFIDVGITLKVTPHVYEDELGPYVKLDLNPRVSFPSGFKNGVPIESVRQSTTTANVRDKQTLVVGGIISEKQRDMVEKVPILGDLPLLGVLFRNKSKSKERTELMIFVTPTIHKKPEDISWEKMVIGENYSILTKETTETVEPQTVDPEKE